jgi:hypothetical protein
MYPPPHPPPLPPPPHRCLFLSLSVSSGGIIHSCAARTISSEVTLFNTDCRLLFFSKLMSHVVVLHCTTSPPRTAYLPLPNRSQVQSNPKTIPAALGSSKPISPHVAQKVKYQVSYGFVPLYMCFLQTTTLPSLSLSPYPYPPPTPHTPPPTERKKTHGPAKVTIRHRTPTAIYRIQISPIMTVLSRMRRR